MTHAHNPTDAEAAAARLRAALESADLEALGAMLDDHVRWGGEEDTPETCHTRAEVLSRLARRRAGGLETRVLEVVSGDEAVLLGLGVKRPVRGGFGQERPVYQVLKLRNQRVVDIRGYPTRLEAAAHAGVAAGEERAMEAREVIPILNVSSLSASFEWFARLGWVKKWEWREPDGMPTFGAVGSGGCEIFLCLDGQGGRGREGGIGGGGQGVWLSVWVDDVDAVHATCVGEGLEVLHPPQDEPWGVREMQVRHPDGHVLRISQAAHTH